jgi:hypothetical protein
MKISRLYKSGKSLLKDKTQEQISKRKVSKLLSFFNRYFKSNYPYDRKFREKALIEAKYKEISFQVRQLYRIKDDLRDYIKYPHKRTINRALDILLELNKIISKLVEISALFPSKGIDSAISATKELIQQFINKDYFNLLKSIDTAILKVADVAVILRRMARELPNKT